jgi:RNA polymerase sigma-70 factor (ECF subfamily)
VATVRQASHRAREHVAARRPRFDTDAARQREVLERFLAACAGGDVNEVMALLAPGVTAWADGGGKVSAATRPVHGDSNVARWLLGVMARPHLAGLESEHALVNGEPGLRLTVAGVPAGVLSVGIVDGRIAELRLVVNPDKLARV